ncbi:uncharacterized protein LOC129802006 isoform X3 [Phlebotomus papatasi]|uniref:uncharacterized protein LOC129802006 isoform X3 n=1 Tax=Phlebotomus papatasi TaxID=29031 RepID=UPI0024835DAB|nr:uncharacterized protein LOC129802006 isoform X3 [Phlebotomus papatasi]
MGVLQGILILLCLHLSANVIVQAASGYLDILKARGDQNGSVFDLEFNVTSGIYKSKFDSNVREIYRLHIIPYGSDKVYISAKEVESFVRNGDVTDPDEYSVDISDKKLKDFILTSEGKIIVRKNDPENNWNFYKTIGNFLIFDYSVFEDNRKEERSVFKSVLPTIYGSCNINSIGAMTGWNSFSVKQFFDPFGTDCENSTSKNVRVLSDVEGLTKPHGLKVSNYREYNLLRKKESFILDSLITNQKIFWSPVEGKSLVHFLQTSYKFNFVEESTLSVDDTDFDFESEKNLELVTSNPNQAEKSVINLESMENISTETLINEVKLEFVKIYHIWEVHITNVTVLVPPVGKELTKVISIMEFFKLQQFYDLWILLSKDTSAQGSKVLKFFYKIVPYIGTEECVLFIKKLIILKEVGNNLMEKMLTKLAGSIRQPTPKVAEALKEVWDSNKNVNAALLAYTSALGAGFRTNPAVLHDLMEQAKKDLFTKISESSSNFNDQRLYYQALGNLNCISLADANVIKLRSVMFNNDMLMHLILALEKSTDGQYVFDLMLKILRDVSKSSELKAVALRIALKRMPSYDQYETLARVMDEDTNYELYNLFESSVRAFVKVKELPESALLWLRNREPMSRSMAFAYESPEDYPLAFSVRGYLFFNDLTWGLQQIHFDVYQKYDDRPIKMYTVFIRLFDVDKLSFLPNMKRILMEQGNINYEFFFYRGDTLIMSLTDNFDFQMTLGYLMECVQDFTLFPLKTHMEDVFQHYNFDYFFPTDTGRNVHLYFNVPWMISSQFNSLKVAERSVVMNILGSFNFTAQSVTGLYIYQPKLQALQGSRELSSVHLTEQIAFKVYRNKTLEDFNLFIELTEALSPLFGIRFKKATTVHLNKIGGEPLSINKGEHFNQQADVSELTYELYDLLEFQSDFGFKYHMQVFDYKYPANNKEFPESLEQMMYKRPFSDIFKASDENFLVSLLSYINWNFLAHSAYSYNFKATIEPSDVFPITKYALGVSSRGELLIEFKDKDDNVQVYYKVIHLHICNTEILRMGPRVKSSGFCLRKIIDNSDESMYHLYYGTSSGDLTECPTDQFGLALRLKSAFSLDQKDNGNDERLTYTECTHKSPYLQSKDPTNNHRCGKAATTLRDMDMSLKYQNVPKHFLIYFDQFWTWFLTTNNGVPLKNKLKIRTPGEIILKASYPMTSPNVNLDVLLPENAFSFNFPPDLLIPNHVAIEGFTYAMEYFFPAPYCVIVSVENRLKSNRHYLHTDSDTWTMYATIKSVIVYVKKIFEDQLALKIEYRNTTITAYPKINSTSSDKYDITIGENEIDLVPMNWARRRIQSVKVMDTIFFVPDVTFKEQIFMIGYNGRSVSIWGSNFSDKNIGKCFGLQAQN